MKLPEMTDETFLRLAQEEDHCEIAAGSLSGVLPRQQAQAAAAPVTRPAFGSLITQSATLTEEEDDEKNETKVS